VQTTNSKPTVNLILFEPEELSRPLARADRRALHLLEVLRRQPGDTFDAGIINGPRGKGALVTVGPETVDLTFAAEFAPSPVAPITLIVGLPRPQTARDILREASTLGVAALHFVRTDKGDPNYAQSTLWTSGEWRRHVLAGAEQAFATQIPEVTHHQTLTAMLESLGAGGQRLALDNYESAAAFSSVTLTEGPIVLAIGSERGWSTEERDQLRTGGFTLLHLGARVLRTETAVIATLAIVRAKLGLM
jgi:16S rRNA (uracil1498-N3)-methyltransferase